MYIFVKKHLSIEIVPLRRCNVLRLFNVDSMCLASIDTPICRGIQKKKNTLNGYHCTGFWRTVEELWFPYEHSIMFRKNALLGTIPALAKINCISLLRVESLTLKPLRCGFMSCLHSPNVIHCVSADEVPWPQESPTSLEKPHFAITDTLQVLKDISDIPHWSIIKWIAYKLKHFEIDSRLLRSCTLKRECNKANASVNWNPDPQDIAGI